MDKSEAGKKGYQKTKHLLEAHIKQQKQTALEKYESNPKFCPNCDKKLPYEKRYNKFATNNLNSITGLTSLLNRLSLQINQDFS